MKNITITTTANIKLTDSKEFESVAYVSFADVGINGDIWLDVSDYTDNIDETDSDTRNSVVDRVLEQLGEETEVQELHFWLSR